MWKRIGAVMIGGIFVLGAMTIIAPMRKEHATNPRQLINQDARKAAEGVEVKSNRNESAVKGKLVDWHGNPVPGIKMFAFQMEKIEGYEELETVTKPDGSFELKGLYPGSRYSLQPWSDKWVSSTTVKITSAPRGETSILSSPMTISRAYSRTNGSGVINLVTGRTRFTSSQSRVITDAATSLEWIILSEKGEKEEGPPQSEAFQMVANCQVGGGGWRMPTSRELLGLYERGFKGKRNRDILLTGASDIWTSENHAIVNIESGRRRGKSGYASSMHGAVFGVRGTMPDHLMKKAN